MDEYGLIQAIEFVRKDVFAVGVQWHPELMPHSAVQTSFFRALITACLGEATAGF